MTSCIHRLVSFSIKELANSKVGPIKTSIQALLPQLMSFHIHLSWLCPRVTCWGLWQIQAQITLMFFFIFWKSCVKLWLMNISIATIHIALSWITHPSTKLLMSKISLRTNAFMRWQSHLTVHPRMQLKLSSKE